MNKKASAAVAVALNAAAVLAAAPAHAQSAGGAAAAVPQTTGHSYAGSTLGSPMAFGADWGTIGFGAYYQALPGRFDGRNRLDNDRGADGSAALVIGLGDADEYVGLETALVTSSLTGSKVQGDERFGNSGGMSFKLHTNLPGGAALAAGVIGTSRWGDSEEAYESSVYAVGTKVFTVGPEGNTHALVVNLGAGNHSFAHQLDGDGVNAFGSIAYFITRQISVVVDWTGRYLNAGMSTAPFDGIPLVFSVGAMNTTERFHSNRQVGGSVGYTFSF